MAEFIDNYTHEDGGIFYVETNIPGPGSVSAVSNVSFCVQCTCASVCNENCQCVQYSGSGLNYVDNIVRDKKMSSESFILECNEFCKCPSQCGNRIVQLGPRKDLSIFHTGIKGNGLKTETFIKQGSFICEYAGEVISRETAKSRAQHDGVNYIFVLKEHFSGSFLETIIDPTCIGNIGRYINHSCQPNSAIVPVRIDSPVPRLAVFSINNIEAGEEITYDYSSGGTGIGKVKCLCGTANCRGFLPFDKDLLN